MSEGAVHEVEFACHKSVKPDRLARSIDVLVQPGTKPKGKIRPGGTVRFRTTVSPRDIGAHLAQLGRVTDVSAVA